MDYYYRFLQFKAKLIGLTRYSTYWYEYFLWRIYSKFRKNKPFPSKLKKVLIVNHGALGDVFTSLRVALTLIRDNKGIKIDFLCGDSEMEKVRFIGPKINLRFVGLKSLNIIDYDEILLFSASSEEYSKLIGGFIVGNEYSGIYSSLLSHHKSFIDKKIKPSIKNRHKVEQEIRICQAAGLKIKMPLATFKNKKPNNERYAILHPSGRNFSDIIKQGKIPAMGWPSERFANIADYIIEKYKMDVFVTGEKNDKIIADKILEEVTNKEHITNLSGNLSIKGLMEVISKADILISVDTSAVHIAEFTGTPVIALFGPTFPEEVGAYGNEDIQINLFHKDKCIRDRQKGPSHDKQNICMGAITTKEVKSSINRLLEKNLTSRPLR